jgi:protein-S-isoprenylcysteine O-methyltransferase Ste14
MEGPTKFVVVCWVVIAFIWVISAMSVKPTRERQPLPGRLLYLLFTTVVVVLLSRGIREGYLAREVLPHTLWTGILADVIVLAGLVVAIWARAVLGGNWSARVTLKENHELIRRGPYRIVRHPIYSGLLLMVLGTAVLVGRVSGFFALLVCFCGFWVKSRQEEALLTSRLPGYSEYKARTKALVPFVF